MEFTKTLMETDSLDEHVPCSMLDICTMEDMSTFFSTFWHFKNNVNNVKGKSGQYQQLKMWSEIGFVKYQTRILEQFLNMKVQQTSKHSSLFFLGTWPTWHTLPHTVQIPVVFRYLWYFLDINMVFCIVCYSLVNESNFQR